MTLGGPGSEQHRLWVGLAVLALGVALLLFAWFSWLYRTSTQNGVDPIQPGGQAASLLAPTDSDDAAARVRRRAFVEAAPMFLLVTFLLVVVFLIGSFVLVRAVRRYVAAGDRRRPPPTASDDVWSMHRPPGDAGGHSA